MKKINLVIFTIILITSIYPAYSQTEQSFAIPLTVIAAKQQSVPETAVASLNDKLMQIITRNGMGTADYNSRFAITASIVTVTKNILAGPPRQYSETLNITLYVVDNIDEKIFSSVTIPIKVVETTEEKAIIKAIQSVDINSASLAEFVNLGRSKIIAYYKSHSDNIISKAQILASQNKYEAALFELNSIPVCCTEEFNKGVKVAKEIYNDYVDHCGELYLSKAKAIWMAEQNLIGAKKAGEFLSKISSSSRIYSSAEKLYREIKDKVKNNADFRIKQYEDGVKIKVEKINAWKEVGIAYGKGQQPINTNITWLLK